MMALMAIIMGLGLLFYILLGFRYESGSRDSMSQCVYVFLVRKLLTAGFISVKYVSFPISLTLSTFSFYLKRHRLQGYKSLESV